MGSSSSSLGSLPSQPRVRRGMKRSLESLVCGSKPHAPTIHQMEEYPVGLLACSTAVASPIVINHLQTLKSKEHSSIHSAETSFLCSTTETGTSSNCDNEASEEKCLSANKELLPDVENADCTTIMVEPYVGNMGTSRSVNVRGKHPAESEIDVSLKEEQPQTEGIYSSSTTTQDHQESCPGGILSVKNPVSENIGTITDLSSAPGVSVSLLTSPSLSDDIASLISQETAPPVGLGLLMSDMHQDRRNGSIIHVDVVSIFSSSLYSNSGEIGNLDGRRSSRRLFWDALSRRGSGQHSDSRTIFFSNGDSDEAETPDRWLLDSGNESSEDGIGSYSGFLNSRRRGYNGRQHLRSELWERFRGGLLERNRRTALCASGLHPDGTCSCDSISVNEESSTRGSISRIVMLAEALFEVLDEIHHQPLSFSLSPLSCPAPESVVNSFTLKSHKKTIATDNGDDVEQCYICLAEYEEDDKIRILPCCHEFHKSCVDKWLIEIHGVCPLCRGDVSVGAAEGSVSST